jgi:streptogramin lyase
MGSVPPGTQSPCPEALVIAPTGRVWAPLIPSAGGRLLELDPRSGLMTVFHDLPGQPYVRIDDIAVGGRSAVWYPAVAGPNNAAIGRLDSATGVAEMWTLPVACAGPWAIWFDRTTGHVWFTSWNWNYYATGGAFVGRLDPGAGMVDYWELPGYAPRNPGIAGEQVAPAQNLWFTHLEFYAPTGPPKGSRVYRLDLRSLTFYEYLLPVSFPSFAPFRVRVDSGGNAWVADGNGEVRSILRGADCGVAQFKRGRAKVSVTAKPVKVTQDYARLNTHSAAPSTTTIQRYAQDCYRNYPVGAGATMAVSVVEPTHFGAPRIFFTNASTNQIGRLTP